MCICTHRCVGMSIKIIPPIFLIANYFSTWTGQDIHGMCVLCARLPLCFFALGALISHQGYPPGGFYGK